jgi:hypothetical protein
MSLASAAGRVARIDEPNYRYGEGQIIFHISQVVDRVINDGAPWVMLIGRQEYPDGRLSPLRTITTTAKLDGMRAVAP